MEVIVLGSGVIGLTSAWYLSQAGYQVTVIDRQANSAMETSFANAGQISYGYSSPWAAPGIPLKAIKWLTEEHAPLKIKPSLSPDLIRWATQMVSNAPYPAIRSTKQECSLSPIIAVRVWSSCAVTMRLNTKGGS